MTFDHHVLLWLLALPLLAACVVYALGPNRAPAARNISLATSLVVVLLALILVGRFMSLDRSPPVIDPNGDALPTFKPEFVPGSTPDNPHQTTWTIVNLGNGSVQFYLGVDGLSIWMVVLTAVLMVPAVLISWTYIGERVNEYYAWLLALQTTMIGVFLAMDIVLFYVFFELTLIPLFFLIGIWGGSQRQYAARKFFIYTIAGSLLTLLGMIGIVVSCYSQTKELTFSIPRLVELVHDPAMRSVWASTQVPIFLLLMVGFMVKVPLMPFHTWLPLAHVEAPTAGSVDLAGVLLKIGVYGFLRLCIPLTPDASLSVGVPLMTTLAALGIVYGAFTAYSQDDVKRLVAYSSVSHLGLCVLALFSLNSSGINGALMQMINHGLSTGALFLLVGMLYERYHTRDIGAFGGMAKKMPLFAVFLVFMCLSSAGLPGLNGFVGELLCFAGVVEYESKYSSNYVLSVVAVSGLILGAWYLFTMLQRILFGPLKEPDHHGHEVGDLKPREWLMLTPIAALCLLIGLFPQPILNASKPDVDTVVHIANAARERANQKSAVPVDER